MGFVGYADLPLHTGHVPPWLLDRMRKLSTLIVRLMVDEYGVRGTIRLFSNPIFFQSFNNIIGMDWDSSGSTTVTTAVLKYAFSKANLGVRVVGGKGEASLRVPEELRELAKRGFNIDPEELANTSRLVAKVDNVALQDGYRLYHHAMFIGEDGTWAVVQQGLNTENRYARRYHWWMETTYINNPHSGIVGVKGNWALNMVSSLSSEARKAVVDIVGQGPLKVRRDFDTIKAMAKARGNASLLSYMGLGEAAKPLYYNPRLSSIIGRLSINEDAVKAASGAGDFKELLLTRGFGPNTMLALALIAQLIYEVPVDWSDPANIDPRRFAFAVGGKDGSPYPVNREVYDSVIEILSAVVDNIRRNSELKPMLKYLAAAAKRLNLPLDLVRPT